MRDAGTQLRLVTLNPVTIMCQECNFAEASKDNNGGYLFRYLIEAESLTAALISAAAWGRCCETVKKNKPI